MTTATTVGYGDYYAHNRWEMLFMIFVQVGSICFFSTITVKITGMKKERKILDIVEEKVSSYNTITQFSKQK